MRFAMSKREVRDTRQAQPASEVQAAAEAPDLLFNQSLEKGLAVLRAFSAQRRTMTLAEVAEATAITKSSAQRMVYTLETLGYVCKHPKTRRYQLTPKVMEVGYNYLAADILVDVANPFLSELANITGETVNLTEPYDRELFKGAGSWTSNFIPTHRPSAAAFRCIAR